MNNDRGTILALIAAGRITPAQAEHLLAAMNETRETIWILGLCLGYACLAQLHLHELVTGFMHFMNTQVPVLAEAMRQALSPMRGEWGGLL